MERLAAMVAAAVAVAVLAVDATPVGVGLVAASTRSIVPEVTDMGVTGRRSSGPGPAGEAHAHLTLAITAAPSARLYQHGQGLQGLHGGLVRPEPADGRPLDEDALQSGLTRRKRAEQPAQDQEAEASSRAAEEAVDEDDAEAAASEGAADDGDMFLEPDAAPSPTGEPAAPAANADTAGQPQNLFPAFQPLFPLGHSRPALYQEPTFPQRQALLRPQQYSPFAVPLAEAREPRLDQGGYGHAGPHAFRERAAYPQQAAGAGIAAAPAELHANALLGSGNFGVIHGGTFYGEEKESQDYEAPLHSFYGGNGHGRPAFYRGNPEPQRYRTAEDFFANFRDFADISTPTKSSFSEYYVVYVNRNASRADPGTVVGPEGRPPTSAAPATHAARPNNIFERLAQIDREHALNSNNNNNHSNKDGEEAPKKKLSLAKRKLALLDKKKAPKKTSSSSASSSAAAATSSRESTAAVRDALHEPLLALS